MEIQEKDYPDRETIFPNQLKKAARHIARIWERGWGGEVSGADMVGYDSELNHESTQNQMFYA